MPHIHTAPNQHDMTVSAWVLLQDEGEWKCLVHFHRKIDKYMQVGGHIELDETPWQSMAHELSEESGYELSELEILQFDEERLDSKKATLHPLPFNMNTHLVNNQHYHTDIAYAFVAHAKPTHLPIDGESSDVRFVTVTQLKAMVAEGTSLPDILQRYDYLVRKIDTFVRVPTSKFSLKKPDTMGASYKR